MDVKYAGYAGLAAGIRYLLQKGLKSIIEHEGQLTHYLLEKLREIEEMEVYAPEADRVGTICFDMKGATPSDVSHYLDFQWGICTRPGLR